MTTIPESAAYNFILESAQNSLPVASLALTLASTLELIGAEVILPSALAVGWFQILQDRPLPQAVWDKAEAGDIRGAFQSAYQHTNDNAYRLFNRGNALGRIVHNMAGPFGETITAYMRKTLKPVEPSYPELFAFPELGE